MTYKELARLADEDRWRSDYRSDGIVMARGKMITARHTGVILDRDGQEIPIVAGQSEWHVSRVLELAEDMLARFFGIGDEGSWRLEPATRSGAASWRL